jgi:hypothetical protein
LARQWGVLVEALHWHGGQVLTRAASRWRARIGVEAEDWRLPESTETKARMRTASTGVTA